VEAGGDSRDGAGRVAGAFDGYATERTVLDGTPIFVTTFMDVLLGRPLRGPQISTKEALCLA